MVGTLAAPQRLRFGAVALYFNAGQRVLMDRKGQRLRVRLIPWLLQAGLMMFIGLPLGAAAWLCTAAVLGILTLGPVRRWLCARVRRNEQEQETVVGFFWSVFPDAAFDYIVGGEVSHIVGFFSGLQTLGVPAFMVGGHPLRHPHFTTPYQVVDQRFLPVWPGELMQMAYNWKVLWKSRRIIQERNPTIIYHRANAFSFIGVLLSIIYRLPLFLEMNSSTVAEARRWGGGRFGRVLALAERVNMMYANRIAVVSEVFRDTLVAQGVAADKIVVNPNGVDVEVFAPAAPDAQVVDALGLRGRVGIGFIGSFAHYHGVIPLARAVRLVCDRDPRARFIMMGDGPLRTAVEQILREDGMLEAVMFPGKVAHERVPAYLNACQILVSPHQHMADGSTFYGSPTKLFEYMAMAKGVVASRVGQLEDLLEDEVSALLVPPADPERLAEAILRLVRDPALAAELGRAARREVCRAYTWEANARRIIWPDPPGSVPADDRRAEVSLAHASPLTTPLETP